MLRFEMCGAFPHIPHTYVWDTAKSSSNAITLIISQVQELQLQLHVYCPWCLHDAHMDNFISNSHRYNFLSLQMPTDDMVG
jgi:hypothetical protein